MTAIFIAYNQAYYEEISELLEKQGVRGFTRWNEITGRGSEYILLMRLSHTQNIIMFLI